MKTFIIYFAAALTLYALIMGALAVLAALVHFLVWPICFEQWLGPIPWRGSCGVAFLIAIARGYHTTPKGKSSSSQ